MVAYLVPSGASGFDCRRAGSQIARDLQVVSVIPATFEQDQFSVNIDHQITRRTS